LELSLQDGPLSSVIWRGARTTLEIDPCTFDVLASTSPSQTPTPTLPYSTATNYHRLRTDGVLQSQAVDRCRSWPVQPFQQGLCAIDQKRQGPENRERAVPATRHSLLVKSLQSMPRDCAARLLEKRFDRQILHVKSETNPFQSHLSFYPTRQLDPTTFQMANISSRIRMLSSPEWTCSKWRRPSMMSLCYRPYWRKSRTARYRYIIVWCR
jgi:hypothetical protein